jgi:hypothetical protein
VNNLDIQSLNSLLANNATAGNCGGSDGDGGHGSLTAVPEPAAIGLLSLAAISLAGVKLQHRRRHGFLATA